MKQLLWYTTGDIHYATCTCTAGGSCNHAAALAFAIDAHNRTKLTPAPSCISVPSKWNVPKSNKAPKDIPVSTQEAILPYSKKQDYHHLTHLLAHIRHK